MTYEQINIAIAEACGWRQSERNIAHWHHVSEPYSHILTGDLPNYCNDLNAMHEAEKMLGEKRIRSYAFILAQVLDTSPTVDLDDQFLNIHATALQRAEAFLRTLGKWEEAK